MGEIQYLDAHPLPPVSPVVLSAALMQDKFMSEGEFITQKPALRRSEACFCRIRKLIWLRAYKVAGLPS